MVNANAAANTTPAAQAANAAHLAAAKAARQGKQVAAKATPQGTGKGAGAVAKVGTATRSKRPAFNLALRASAKGTKRNAPPTAKAPTAVQAKQASAYAAAAQVVHVARRHNGVTLAGVHYAMRKVATGRWLVQVAPTAAYSPAPTAPVLAVGGNLVQCVALAATHRATTGKASKATSTRKAGGKAKAPVAAPQAAQPTPGA